MFIWGDGGASGVPSLGFSQCVFSNKTVCFSNNALLNPTASLVKVTLLKLLIIVFGC